MMALILFQRCKTTSNIKKSGYSDHDMIVKSIFIIDFNNNSPELLKTNTFIISR